MCKLSCESCGKMFSYKKCLSKHISESKCKTSVQELVVEHVVETQVVSTNSTTIDTVMDTVTTTTETTSEHTELMTILRSKFTTNDQFLFVHNFHTFLTNDRNTDFVIDFDDIYHLVGFTQKCHAKRLLVAKLTENVHFRVQKPALPPGRAGLQIGGAGINKEQILLTINGFKKFCLKSDTKRADEIHEYYIKMEDAVFEYTANKMEAIKALNEQNLQNTKLIENKVEKSLFDAYTNKKVVYLATVAHDIVKFGYTDNLKERVKQHHRDFGVVFKLEHVVECDYNRELEQKLKDHAEVKYRRTSQVFNDKNQTELIKIDDKFNIEKVHTLVKTLKKELERVSDVEIETTKRMEILLKIEEEKTKQVECEERTKQCIEKTKQMELQLKLAQKSNIHFHISQ